MSIIWTVRDAVNGRYRTAIKLSPLTRIHIFWRGDADRAHHDHPNDFWTFPLRGYLEEVTNRETLEVSLNYVRPWRWHFREAEYRHRLIGRPDGKLIITLVRERPARRKWGFYPDGQFVYWRQYLYGEKSGDAAAATDSESTEG